MSGNYYLHMDWGWWQETIPYYTRDSLLQFLHGGFVPDGCKLMVEHEGNYYPWDREADYAKPYRYHMTEIRSDALKALILPDRRETTP